MTDKVESRIPAAGTVFDMHELARVADYLKEMGESCNAAQTALVWKLKLKEPDMWLEVSIRTCEEPGE